MLLMPRTVKPLTDTQIKNAKPKVNEYNLADGRGLYLRVKPNGAKEWIFNYYKPVNCSVTSLLIACFSGRIVSITLFIFSLLATAFSNILVDGNLSITNF